MPYLIKSLIINTDLSPIARYRWPLPTEEMPGEWTAPIEGLLIPCKKGYHGVSIDQFRRYFRYVDLIWKDLYVMEYKHRPKVSDDGQETAVRQARLMMKVYFRDVAREIHEKYGDSGVMTHDGLINAIYQRLPQLCYPYPIQDWRKS